MKHPLPVILTALFIVAGCAEHTAAPIARRPANWAQPIELEGAPNLHKVTGNLYRSAQPTAEGMQNLESLGIKTVVNLRAVHSDDDELEGTGLKGERIRFETWDPEMDEIVRFLKLVDDPENQPVLVHCLHGADRTGTMCAIYRVVVEGWSKDDAVREMKEGGYNFHSVWGNLPRWVEKLNVEATREAARLSPVTPE
jgi:protein tyrosine phosphatase (PTP) superfamily phosphohydrolase (DUF442 family)